MNGIDISGHQNGIDLAKVPCDFVIIKATQGTTFVSKDFTRQVEQALSLGKLTGVYHYANGSGVAAEAIHFANTIAPYLDRVIVCLDWEGEQNSQFANYHYCEDLLEAIKAKTGRIPFLYMSKSVCRQYAWEKARNYPLWCAQYKSYALTGYQDNPWTDSKGFGPWAGCQILQYSSKGRLAGYKGDLDLDKAYFDSDQWQAYARGDHAADEPDLSARPTLRKGDHNEYVRAWQRYLISHGYDCGKSGADGKFGNDTEKAVVKYQQDHQMESGYIGPQTWATIE